MEDRAATINDEEVKSLAPLIAFLAAIIVVGIPGNLLVCGMYRKIYKLSSSRFFILALAVVDCIGCFVVSLEVVNVVQQYTFTNRYLCKVTIFLELWPILTSGCLLLIISIDRYRKVCHPFEWQLTLRSGKVLFAISATLSFVLSSPAVILYGITEVRSDSRNFTGTECSILEEYKDSSFSKVYNGMFFLEFVFALGILTLMYSLICFEVMKHERSANQTGFESRYGVNNGSSAQDKHDGNKDSQKGQQVGWSNERSAPVLKIRNLLRRHVAVKKTSTKLTCIMCIISVVFIVSFLPYTVLRLLESYNEDFLESMSETERALYKTFLRTYFLNCAINPVIYCACSTKFRKEVAKYFCELFCRK